MSIFGTTHTRFAVLAWARTATVVALTIVVVLASAFAAPATAQNLAMEPETGLHGSFSTFVDWRRGANSASTRQDLDINSYLDMTYRPDKLWTFAVSASATGDLDGRRPSFEPGIYNGVRETFDHAVTPWLYRLYGTRKLDVSIGGSGKLTALTLGRQYTTGEEFVWIDGLELTGEVPIDRANVTFSVYGGVPVRLFESSSNDWLAGGRLALRIGATRIGIEGYHVEDQTVTGWKRIDNVGRISLAAPIGDKGNLFAMVRGVDDEGLEARVRAAFNLPRDIQLRADVRTQTEARGSHANEVDAASLVMGRASGVMRQAFTEYGGDVLIPINDKWSLDLGGSTRDFKDPQTLNNINFDRYFVSLMASGLDFSGKKLGGNITFEAYNSAADWTRTATGEVTLDMTSRLRLSAGSTYALYSYDYMLNQITNDVRLVTGKIQYRPTDRLRLEARYDLEDDAYRLHHYVHTGFRYDF